MKNSTINFKKQLLTCVIFFFCINAHAQFHQNLTYNGTNNVVDCGDLATTLQNISAFTIEVQVKFTSFTTWATVYAKRLSQTSRDIVLQSYSTNGQMGVGIANGYGYSTTHLSLNVWYHLAVVYDGSASTDATRLKLYINGVQDVLTFLGMGPVPTTTPYSSGSRFCLGAEYNGATAVSSSSILAVPFKGTMDEVRVWNVARSQSSISSDMNTEITSQANLQAYYQFNQGSACGTNTSVTSITDAAGNSNATPWHFSMNGTTSNITTVVDTSVNVSGNTLIANATPANYQWYDCNSHSPINGQTASSFSPASNGSYSVIVTQDFCLDTSSCYDMTNVGIDDNYFTQSETIYPNPTSSKINFFLRKSAQVTVVNAFGEIVLQKDFSNEINRNVELDVSFLSPGIYFLRMEGEMKKFVKQ